MTSSELPVSERAGTLLDHANAQKIYQRRKGKNVYCGILDRTARVYQCGGSLTKQVYWKLKVLGVGVSEWEQIVPLARWFEFIDLDKNRCYRISMDDAERVGYFYDGEWGRRFGIPLSAFTVYDGPGLIPRGSEQVADLRPVAPAVAERPEPQAALF